MSDRGGRGFLFGAAGGLVIALVVIGGASLVPNHGGPSATTETITLATGHTASSSVVAPAVGQSQPSAGNAAGVGVSTSQQSVGPSRTAPVVTTTTIAGALPGSAIGAIPSESLGGVLSVVAPVFVGLLLAAVAYGVFLRRQDSGP